MRKYLLIILCSLFLGACTEEKAYVSDTPDEAVKKLEIDFVKDVKDIQLVEINSEQKISIFRANALNENEREYFVAFIEKKGNKWIAKEAFGVGNPTTTSSFSSGGNLLEAGFINNTNTSFTPQFINGQYIFKLPNNVDSLWVEVLD
ncbi:hypothetical protein JSQ81_04145 [Sporosarcina sp. Marseille-Q4063]|uniref:hypothetical protein n=1 Tax=Sporosarcina sp. Marseille-Q4063 TaxID=2810514 RepID=UPI001BB00E41|nr:hypothetical protein [Sporosarcina sp. Marseille-Q4063]QUW22783.1 hypothetical protein JSQ81_04145 [Sporosarcina sp. Marseille-Q4063]